LRTLIGFRSANAAASLRHRRIYLRACPVTLTTVARAVGLNRTTILRAIKSGKISGTKDEHGEWHIEPAELQGFTRLLRAPNHAPMQRHDTRRAKTWSCKYVQRWWRPGSPTSRPRSMTCVRSAINADDGPASGDHGSAADGTTFAVAAVMAAPGRHLDTAGRRQHSSHMMATYP
jgi:hypothetical protein